MFAELQSRYRCETSFLSCHRRLHEGGVRTPIQLVWEDPTAVTQILAQSARGDPRRYVGTMLAPFAFLRVVTTRGLAHSPGGDKRTTSGRERDDK